MTKVSEVIVEDCPFCDDEGCCFCDHSGKVKIGGDDSFFSTKKHYDDCVDGIKQKHSEYHTLNNQKQTNE